MTNHTDKLPLVVIENKEQWHGEDAIIVCWSSFEVPQGGYSIPQLVEQQGELLKKEYLAWIYELGQLTINGKTIREHLAIREDFSFWWMTLLAEKSPLKSPIIYDIFRLRVLEKLYEKHQCHGLISKLSNRNLNKVLSAWCKNMSHPYSWRGQKSWKWSFYNIRNIYNRLPHLVQAIIFLFRYVIRYRKLLFKIPPLKKTTERSLTMVSYFPNIDMEKAANGIFWSKYWESLHNVLKEFSGSVHWIFLYSPGVQCPTLKEAIQIVNNFQNGNYHFIQEWFSYGVLRRIIKDYFWLLSRWFQLLTIKKHLNFTNMPLWILLAQDCKSSIYGKVAMDGCLKLALFESGFQNLSKQDIGLYLFENQAWEKALIYSWKKMKHKKIIAVQHSSIRFFDLRYFDDPRTYDELSWAMPLPDILAVNGEAAKNFLKTVSFPEKRICLVEALRYLYLNQIVKNQQNTKGKRKSALLVVTDYSKLASITQIKLLAQAFLTKNKDFPLVFIKPHPYCPIDSILAKYMPLFPNDIQIVNKSLENLWGKASVVFASNSTTAAFEAALCGLTVIVALDPSGFNMNPLRKVPGVSFVASAEDLIKYLKHPQIMVVPSDYFLLDESLVGWKRLLKSP